MIAETITMTPPRLARRWGVAPEKILQLIHSGQLRAVNLAVDPKGRPRWRIHLSEIERFEESRSSRPPLPKQPRRRRRESSTGREYF